MQMMYILFSFYIGFANAKSMAEKKCSPLKPVQMIKSEQRAKVDVLIGVAVPGYGKTNGELEHNKEQIFDTSLLQGDDLSRAFFLYQLCIFKVEGLIDEATYTSMLRSSYTGETVDFKSPHISAPSSSKQPSGQEKSKPKLTEPELNNVQTPLVKSKAEQEEYEGDCAFASGIQIHSNYDVFTIYVNDERLRLSAQIPAGREILREHLEACEIYTALPYLDAYQEHLRRSWYYLYAELGVTSLANLYFWTAIGNIDYGSTTARVELDAVARNTHLLNIGALGLGGLAIHSLYKKAFPQYYLMLKEIEKHTKQTIGWKNVPKSGELNALEKIEQRKYVQIYLNSFEQN